MEATTPAGHVREHGRIPGNIPRHVRGGGLHQPQRKTAMQHAAAGVVCLGLGVVLATGSPALAQSSDDSAAMEAPRRFDAGASVVLDHGGRGVHPGGGGWFTVGSGNIRLLAEYWHKQRQEDFDFGFLGRETSSFRNNFFHVAVAKHFRTDRRLMPHLLAGAGYLHGSGEFCSTRGRFPDHRLVCSKDDSAAFVMVTGVGLDISLGSRFFVRIQSRGFIHFQDESNVYVLPLLENALARYLLIGGGVRF